MIGIFALVRNVEIGGIYLAHNQAILLPPQSDHLLTPSILEASSTTVMSNPNKVAIAAANKPKGVPHRLARIQAE